jgi:hypothetical protein
VSRKGALIKECAEPDRVYNALQALHLLRLELTPPGIAQIRSSEVLD